MRCRECFNEFPEWTWENQICPNCIKKHGHTDVTASSSERLNAGKQEKSSPLDLKIEKNDLVADLLKTNSVSPLEKDSPSLITKKENLEVIKEKEAPQDTQKFTDIETDFFVEEIRTSEQPKSVKEKTKTVDKESLKIKFSGERTTMSNAESPGKRVFLEYVTGRFVRMKISEAGINAGAILTFSFLLILFSFLVGLGVPWIFLFVGLPVLLKTISNMRFKETLFITPQTVLHDKTYFSFITLKSSKKADPSMKTILVEPMTHIGSEREVRTNKNRASLVLATQDFKLTIGRTLDREEKIWIRKNLTEALDKLFMNK